MEDTDEFNDSITSTIDFDTNSTLITTMEIILSDTCPSLSDDYEVISSVMCIICFIFGFLYCFLGNVFSLMYFSVFELLFMVSVIDLNCILQVIASSERRCF